MDLELQQQSSSAAVQGAALDPAHQDEMLLRIGQMTRNLHESLRGLGFDKLIERTVQDIPNARDRLEYVALMSEQAAQRVLNAVDIARPLHDKVEEGAAELAVSWQRALDAPFSETEYRRLAERSVDFMDDTRGSADSIKHQLLEIVMAQEFQDLTGQVIKRITELALNLEKQLLQVLVDYTPGDGRRDNGGHFLSGPQITTSGAIASDVVTTQEQVDDLLDSLGF
ncbi:protein phosphatase CheZ [soil metagenome]